MIEENINIFGALLVFKLLPERYKCFNDSVSQSQSTKGE